MKTIRLIAFILTVVGAINWGLVGFFRFDLVAGLFGDMRLITRIIYMLVGLSGFYTLITTYKYLTDEI